MTLVIARQQRLLDPEACRRVYSALDWPRIRASQVQPTQTRSRSGVAVTDPAFSQPAAPLTIPNLELWLRSDLGITLASGKVASWVDQSGNSGRDCAQATAGNQPAYTVSNAGFNNKPTLDFDGATSNRFLAGALPSLSFANWSAMVVTSMTATHQGGIYDATSAGGLTNTGHLMVQATANREWRFGGSLAANIATYAYATLGVMVHIGRYAFAGPGPQIYEKTVQKASHSAGITLPALTQYRIGRLFQNVFSYSGSIAEVAWYSRWITDPELSTLVGYTVPRYAIP